MSGWVRAMRTLPAWARCRRRQVAVCRSILLPRGVEQDRPCGPAADGAIDRASDRRRQRDQEDFGSFAAHPEHALAMRPAITENAEHDCHSAIAFASKATRRLRPPAPGHSASM